jgi:hypothetical protein
MAVVSSVDLNIPQTRQQRLPGGNGVMFVHDEQVTPGSIEQPFALTNAQSAGFLQKLTGIYFAKAKASLSLEFPRAREL